MSAMKTEIVHATSIDRTHVHSAENMYKAKPRMNRAATISNLVCLRNMNAMAHPIIVS